MKNLAGTGPGGKGNPPEVTLSVPLPGGTESHVAGYWAL